MSGNQSGAITDTQQQTVAAAFDLTSDSKPARGRRGQATGSAGLAHLAIPPALFDTIRPAYRRTNAMTSLIPARRARRCGPVAIFALAALLAGALSACSSSVNASNAGGQTITLYNAQHEQTTDAMIAAFTKQTGIKVRVDNDDEDVLTAQIEQEGSRSPADVFYTENSNWLQQLETGACSPRSTRRTLANVPKRDSAANGDWVGVSARISVDRVQPEQDQRRPAAQVDPGPGRPTLEGQDRDRPVGDRLLAARDSVARAKGNAAALAWLKGLKANVGRQRQRPRQRDDDQRRQPGHHRSRGHQPLLLLPAPRPRSRAAPAAPSSPTSRHAIPGMSRTISGRGGAEVEQAPGGRAGVPGLPDQRGRAAHAGQRRRASSTRSAPVSPANPQLPPLSGYQPNPFSPADLGTGSTPSRCCSSQA